MAEPIQTQATTYKVIPLKYGKYRDCESNEDGYGWYFEYTHRKGCAGFDGTENEYVNIIGNIHDNPELLKGE